MIRPKTLLAFDLEQRKKAHALLATRVAFMMGRKFEEDDWAEVYCRAKGIPKRGWSNLAIDIMSGSLGVEHKMIKVESKGDITDKCGTSPMHPSATRSIRVPPQGTNAADAMRDVLKQYGDLIKARTAKVKQESRLNAQPDMRTGWLLWQESLRQFLYFEEQMIVPNPKDYVAEWMQRASRGARKPSTNLWIYEKKTGRKRYSVTTEAGAKIQPYFDVPPLTDPNICVFTVIGEVIQTGNIRVWITEATQRELTRLLGTLAADELSAAVLKVSDRLKTMGPIEEARQEHATAFEITMTAYQALQRALPGVSDEHSFQLLVQHLNAQKI
jgi:hypothetical protein